MGLFSSSETKTTNSSTTPWGPQAGALQTGFDAAGNALTQSQAAAANGAPTNYTAQFDPALMGQFQNMLGYANSTNTGALNQAGNSAATSGANASSAALSKLLGFDPTAQNNPSSLINTANQYVAGQTSGQVRKAAMLNATLRQRVTLPFRVSGRQRQAAATQTARGAVSQKGSCSAA
jgi:hypothetical protein